MVEKLSYDKIKKPNNNNDIAIENSINERKKLLEGELEKGINIKTVEQFNSLILLLQKNGIISSTTNFNSIIDSEGTHISQTGTFGRLPQINGEDILLTIKKKGNDIVVYSAASSLPIRFVDAPRKGYIKQDGLFEYNPDISFISYDDSVKINEMSGNIEAKLELIESKLAATKTTAAKTSAAKKLKSKPAESKPDAAKPAESNITVAKPDAIKTTEKIIEDENYVIKQGDTLWKIVKDRYGITDNLEMANTINSLVKYNKNVKLLKNDYNPEGGDGIRGDKIIVGRNLKLPSKLTFRGKEILKK